MYSLVIVKSECRIVLSGFLGIGGGGNLVRIEADALLYVLGETQDDGFVEVNCVRCGHDLRVFEADLLERTELFHGRAPTARDDQHPRPPARTAASGVQAE